MAPPDPPWKLKTRPCPFYSQGRCLFSNSCNFVHDVKPPRIEASPCSQSMSPLPSPPESPVDMSTSRRRDRRAAKIVRFRSPPRSPRTSSLLMALGDAISQDEPEEEPEEMVEEPEEMPELEGMREEPGRMREEREGMEGEPEQMQVEIIVDSEDEDESKAIPSITPIEDESGGHVLDMTASTPLAAAGALHCGAPDDDDMDPDSAATPRSSRDYDWNTTLGDDEEITMTQFPLPPSSVPASSRRSSGLLSPIDLSASVPPMTFISPEHGASDLHRDHVIAVPPSFRASPPRSPRRLSTFSILSSPFGSPTKRLLGEEHHPYAVSDFFSPAFSAAASQFEDADETRVYYSDVDSRPSSAHGISGDVDEDEEDGDVQQAAWSLAEEDVQAASLMQEDMPSELPVRVVENKQVDLAAAPGEKDLQESHVIANPVEEDAQESDLPAEEDAPVDPLATVKARTLSPVDPPSRRPSVVIEAVSPAKDDTIHNFFDRYASDDLSSSEDYSAPPSGVATPSTQDPVGPAARVFAPRVWTPTADSDYGSPLRSLFDERPARVFSNPVKGKSPVRPDEEWAPTQLASWPLSIQSSWPSSLQSSRPPSFQSSQPSLQSRPPSVQSPRPPSVQSRPPSVQSSRPLSQFSPRPTSQFSPRPPSLQLSRPPTLQLSRPPSQLSSRPASPLSSHTSQLASRPQSLQSSFSLSPLPSPQRSTLPFEHEHAHEHEITPESQEHETKWEERPASTKVPLAWRQSSTSSVGRSASVRSCVARHRPPALTGLSPILHDREWERGPSSSPLRESVSAEAFTAVEADREAPIKSVPSSVPGSSRLKPLRLSMILSAPASMAASPMSTSFQLASALDSGIHIPLTGTTAYTPHSPTVSSDYSLSNARLLSSRRSSLIPSSIHNTLLIESTHVPSHDTSSRSTMLSPPTASPIMPTSAPLVQAPPPWHARKGSRSSVASRRHSLLEGFARPDSRASEPILYEEDEEDTVQIARPASSLERPAPISLAPPSPIHAIATPRPTLLFALASDNVDEVKRVLNSGEVGPNDDVGPQSALAFTLTARQLKHRQEMVKLLLAHGADPTAVKQIHPSRPSSAAGSNEDHGEPSPDALEELDHATKYYIKRAEAPQTRRASALIHRSFFRPLARVRYDLVGQDRALEQLFRVLSMPMAAPIVVLLCGPSGHGKSLLARKFGSLLEVPTHTVNMTTLRDTHDIWRSYSMSPYEASSTCTLADFLIANEGRRCVVVLDEIEKSPNEKALSSLLMPWELGRCSFEAGHRHVDVSQVIWLGTSNIGHDLVFEHQEKRQEPKGPMSREEYVDLMGLLRPRVSHRLGASLLSRVTTVLPFIPFTAEEKLAISAEALHSLTGEETELPPATIDMIVRNSLNSYIPAEGARSLYRAVSNLLLDTI